MNKIFKWLFICTCLLGLISAYLLFSSSTSFTEKSKSIVINELETNKESLVKKLVDEKIISNAFVFEAISNKLNIWDKIKAGKYKIENGENVLNIIRILKNNRQQEIALVINKLRTPNDLAKLIGKNFSTDSTTSLSIIKNTKSDELFYNIIPNTYKFYYFTSVENILKKLISESNKFWESNNRKNKAKEMGLTTYQIHTIASIVEEETNKDDEKGNVASVYINRLNQNMPLGADPTIKFALQDFTLKRIYEKHLQVASPYNTYKNKGLPPSAICTPSIKTIDAVLNAPSTNFLFFCADASFNGYHHFTTNYDEHKKYAALYQQALNERMK